MFVTPRKRGESGGREEWQEILWALPRADRRNRRPKIKEHRGRFVYTGSAGRSIAVPLASRWRHHNTAAPATTTNGTTAICTMIQPAPDSITPEANDDSVTVPNTRKSLNA